MSKVLEIPRALHVPKALLDASCYSVATSSSDVEEIAFFPPPHFTSKMNLDLRIYEPSSSDRMQISDQSRLLIPLMARISSKQSPHSHHSCKEASQA
ncbi:hypothetical protein AVEN_173113-1 [Araneus ventricosus]|uniref:Uncharacterized protein n=1 Tax=Araneus ventricosus TaxID=182803 RepID=A0A4Y2FMI1_ARAVE|nr:hypothetical protein AVEN_173113-1 [Araneus ventricosus]